MGQYLLSIVSTALLVSVSNMLIQKKSVIGLSLKLITGIVLAMLVVSPWTDMKFDDLLNTFSYAEADASGIVQEGERLAQSEISSYIKNQMEAYILDKAFALGLDISADVKLTDDPTPSVASVTIIGSAAPFTRKQMNLIICENLGVTEECLTWSQNSG